LSSRRHAKPNVDLRNHRQCPAGGFSALAASGTGCRAVDWILG
jgi:hypothetical protein